MSGIKRTAADNWFSLYVRCRDNWTCQRCKRKFLPHVEGGDNRLLQGLDNAHCFGRGSHMTRFEPDNCCALCFACHSMIDADPESKRELFIKRVGEKRYQELRVLSHLPFIGFKKAQKEISKRFRELFREMLQQQEKKAH